MIRKVVTILCVGTGALLALAVVVWATEDWDEVTAGASLIPLAAGLALAGVAWGALGLAWLAERRQG